MAGHRELTYCTRRGGVYEIWRLCRLFRVVKSVTGLFIPRSIPRMGHRSPFDFWRSWCRSVDVLLWRLVMSLVVYRHHLTIFVFVSGD